MPSATNATNATYEIYDGSAASGALLGTVTVDQTKPPVGTADGGAQFQSLGDYFPESGKLTVVLEAGNANGNVVADAVVTQAVKHGKKTKATPVNVRVVYNAGSESVSLTLAGKPAFLRQA